MFIAVNESQQRFCSFEEDEVLMRSLSKSCSLLCPDCHSMVIYRAGSKKPHFAHHKVCINPNPYSEPESDTHRIGKFLLYTWLKGIYPKSEVQMEYYLFETKQRSDIMVIHPDGARWAFEFQCSKITGALWLERHMLYESANVQDFWILNHQIVRSVDDNNIRFIGLEDSIYKKQSYLAYLDVPNERVRILAGIGTYRFKSFQSTLDEMYIHDHRLWIKEYSDFFEWIDREKEEHQRNKIEKARQKAINEEITARREQIENEKKQRDMKIYYRDILSERIALTKNMTEKEKTIFLRLTKKYNIIPENFPAMLHVEVQYSDLIKTPKQMWQLWVFDDIISQWDYFIRKNKDPKVWLDNTKNRFMKLKENGFLRIKFNSNERANYIFTLYNYIERLNECGVLENLGSTTVKYQRIRANHLPLLNSHRENILLKMYLEGYQHESVATIGQQFMESMWTVQDRSNKVLSSHDILKPSNILTVARSEVSTTSKHGVRDDGTRLITDKVVILKIIDEVRVMSKVSELPLNIIFMLENKCRSIIRSYLLCEHMTESNFIYLSEVLSEAQKYILSWENKISD
ncbi:competence protein CoiA [Paenibacillus sp. PastF-3]|uniref:competence protein CoiA n=1 Tax=Paenibacillus sp. PastF-3 TaxID=2940626 RepID=UPI00247399B6|nr:competence protein CoiA family protein [Paenibacillus sp. PastF-3]MDH6373681.1 competence protein CoiA [Paenibacillus sp. PastF-3]